MNKPGNDCGSGDRDHPLQGPQPPRPAWDGGQSHLPPISAPLLGAGSPTASSVTSCLPRGIPSPQKHLSVPWPGVL